MKWQDYMKACHLGVDAFGELYSFVNRSFRKFEPSVGSRICLNIPPLARIAVVSAGVYWKTNIGRPEPLPGATLRGSSFRDATNCSARHPLKQPLDHLAHLLD